MEERKEYYFIDDLRAAAILMIAWPHLGINMNPEWSLDRVIQWLINRPLNMIQSFGALGVSLFFLISGFLILKNRRNTGKYLLHRFFRLYLPLLLTMAVFWGVTTVCSFFRPTYWTQFSPIEWIEAATLWNNFRFEINPINGVLWYLVPLIVFDVLYAVQIPLAKKAPLSFVLSTDILIMLLCIVGDDILFFPEGIRRNAPFLTICLFGTLLYLKSTNQIKNYRFCMGILINYFVMVTGFYLCQPGYYQDNPYMTSVIFGVLIFTIGLLLESKLSKPPVWVRRLSQISYSFYITHSLYGAMIISFLINKLPFTIVFLIGILISLVVADINYHLIEKTIGKLVTIK